MTGDETRRLLRVCAWLLTPLVVWAASFLGGWIGAVIGRNAGSPNRGLMWLGAGAVVGAAGGMTGWILLLRRGFRPAGPGVERAPDQPAESAE